MVCRSYMFFNLLLFSYSVEYGVKKYITDISGYSGINPRWYSPCPNTWGAVTNARLNACFPKRPDTQFCVLLSSSYNISKVNELYVNIKTETRNCSSIRDIYRCTGKFNVSVHYETVEHDLIPFVLPNEIPKQIKHSLGSGEFYKTDDDISFSVKQDYNRLKLGFQAPFYCGVFESVSLYYYLCPAKTNALADFSEVLAPSKISSPSISVGTCTKNAVKKYGDHSLFMKCYYNGTAEVFGGCECEAGFTNFHEKKRCQG